MIVTKMAMSNPPKNLNGKAMKEVEAKILGDVSPKLTVVERLYFPRKNPERRRLTG